MSWQQAVILGILEGLTEFLPISSTGHMVIASHFMNIHSDPFVKGFEVIIQFAAILSVLFIYWRRFLTGPKFLFNLLIAFLPTGIIGFLLKSWIDQLLESVIVVAWSLIIGGIILKWSDHFFKKNHHEGKTTSQLNLNNLLQVGLYQCLSMIPGVSRSGATILGGLFNGMKRMEAAEFSFFLAVPTMAAASGYKLLKVWPLLDSSKWDLLIIGSVISFWVALLSIKLMMRVVGKHGFQYFGYYRILLGAAILLLAG